MNRRMNFFHVFLLSLGHAVTDLNQGAIPGILPVLRDAYGLSYAMTGAIVMTSHVTSSIIQPFFGLAADRRSWAWLLPLSVFAAGAGMGLLSVANGYGLLLAAVALTGIGVAGYHPEGSRIAYSLSSRRRGAAMSLFSVGGNVGMALGPVLAAACLAVAGIRGVFGFMIVSSLTALLLGTHVGRMTQLESLGEDRSEENQVPAARESWKGEMVLLAIVALRALLQSGVVTYMPFRYVDDLGGDPESVGGLLVAFLGAGAVGTLISGPLGDFFGRKRVLTAATALLFPVHMLLLSCRGTLLYVMLALEGILTISTFTVTLVMAQEYLPSRIAFAGGLNIGLSTGMGGLASGLLGIVADKCGLLFTLRILGIFPLAALALSAFLPPTNRPARPPLRSCEPPSRVI